MASMQTKKWKRVPKHVGVIPDGNRRWAVEHQMEKQEGYFYGVDPGFRLCKLLLSYGVQEVTFYGFTKDNTKRPSAQTVSYVKACVAAVNALKNMDANVMVIGKTDSKVFPDELKPYANQRICFGKGLLNVNILINYDWHWDLEEGLKNPKVHFIDGIQSKNIPMIDMIIRWGGRTRLSGFLPVQSVYSDFYIVEDYWPAFREQHVVDAFEWYQTCDVTLGG